MKVLCCLLFLVGWAARSEARSVTVQAKERDWRFESPAGVVRAWTPAGYRASSAGIVIYVHGYFTQVDAVSGPGVIDWWKGDGSLIDFFNPG